MDAVDLVTIIVTLVGALTYISKKIVDDISRKLDVVIEKLDELILAVRRED